MLFPGPGVEEFEVLVRGHEVPQGLAGLGLGAGLGTITSSQGERNVQFALKFIF